MVLIVKETAVKNCQVRVMEMIGRVNHLRNVNSVEIPLKLGGSR